MLEALHQLMDKSAVLNSDSSDISGFLHPAFPGSQTQQPVGIYHRPQYLKSIPEGSEIQNGDTGNHKNLPASKYFHIPIQNPQQEVHVFSHPG